MHPVFTVTRSDTLEDVKENALDLRPRETSILRELKEILRKEGKDKTHMAFDSILYPIDW